MKFRSPLSPCPHVTHSFFWLITCLWPQCHWRSSSWRKGSCGISLSCCMYFQSFALVGTGDYLMVDRVVFLISSNTKTVFPHFFLSNLFCYIFLGYFKKDTYLDLQQSNISSFSSGLLLMTVGFFFALNLFPFRSLFPQKFALSPSTMDCIVLITALRCFWQWVLGGFCCSGAKSHKQQLQTSNEWYRILSHIYKAFHNLF